MVPIGTVPTGTVPVGTVGDPAEPCGYGDADVRELIDTLARLASGRPRPELVLGWVLAMLESPTVGEPAQVSMGDVLDSVEVAHAFRCEEFYVGWCCEVGVRRGQLAHRPPPRRPGGARTPLDAWSRSTLDPLARLALEAVFDELTNRGTGEGTSERSRD